MRKMKKINGYLVVKFNDRELREWEGSALGNYGVIDAELYTGTLDVDRSVMEYDDAETLEEAIEKARGLESELDVEEPEVKITVVKETDDRTVEQGPVDPQLMIAGWEATLGQQIGSHQHKDIDERTATHELHGFKVALNQLGILSNEDTVVDPDTFGGYDIPHPLPREPEELLSYICDEVCKEHGPGRTQEELDAVCAKCAVERLANEGDERDLRVRSAAHSELNKIIDELRGTPLNTRAERLEHEARAFLKALELSRTVTERESAAFTAAIEDALKARPYTAERATFENLHPEIKRDPLAAKIYAMGLALSADCPDNDCRVFLNIFNMARDLDGALDELGGNGAPALALRRELRDRVGELVEMYRTNYAVQKYKEAMQP